MTRFIETNHFVRILVFPNSEKTAPALRSDTNSAIASRSFKFRKRKLQHSHPYRSIEGQKLETSAYDNLQIAHASTDQPQPHRIVSPPGLPS